MKILFLLVLTAGILSYVSGQTTSTPAPMLVRRAIVNCGESNTGGSCSCDTNTAAGTIVLLNCNNVPATSSAL